MTMSDFDLINAELAGPTGPRNAFGRDATPGDELTGDIIGAERRHRTVDGKPLYWVNRKPSTVEAGSPVIDSVLIFQTTEETDENDDGQRFLRLDTDVKTALNQALAAAGVNAVAPGGRLEGFTFLRKATSGGRVYGNGKYLPPSA
ncbi:hypothetical protein AB0L82_43360 [Nocardia sp. NPDC052001]|uniref:hypothetical protein n=1 Tax=Nocardia sp. NPDC052001 TaxID=3154853 RepID=UPI003440EE34